MRKPVAQKTTGTMLSESSPASVITGLLSRLQMKSSLKPYLLQKSSLTA